MKIKTRHYSAQMFDNLLADTEDYTIRTAISLIQSIVERSGENALAALLDPETIATLQVALNVPKVRQVTGKKPKSSKVSDATLVLYSHAAPSHGMEDTKVYAKLSVTAQPPYQPS